MAEQSRPMGGSQVAPLLLGAFLAALAIWLPPLLWLTSPPIVGNTYGKESELFELFAFSGSIALLGIATPAIRRRRAATWRELVPPLLFLLVAFHFLAFISENSLVSWDYRNYQLAAEAIREGRNPYVATGYLYPPLPARVLLGLERWVGSVDSLSPAQVDQLVFYLYQCTQFALVLLAYALCFEFTRRLGVDDLRASLLVAAIFLFDDPLARTLKHNQVNLWILDAALLALLYFARRPWLAGLALAVAFHVKIYPAILLLPLLLTRRFAAIGWFAAGAAGIGLLETDFGRDLGLWRQLIATLESFPRSTNFRNNSVHSILINVFGFGWFTNALIGIAMLGIAGAFVRRFFEREASYRRSESSAASGDLRTQGHMVDALLLMLLISPMVWEHHYVIVLPAILWGVVAAAPVARWRLGIAAFLILVIPTFDVFPFSYHRIAGLVLLTWCIPAAIPAGRPAPAKPTV